MATSERNADLKKNQSGGWFDLDINATTKLHFQFTKFINMMQQKSNLIWGIDKA